MPDTSVKSADVAWIANERRDAVPPKDKRQFAHVCPDFVAEINPPSDSWTELQSKMSECMANGKRLPVRLAD